MDNVKILLVEDDSTWFLYFDRMVAGRQDRIRFVRAETLRGALEVLRADGEVGLVLLDLLLPDSSYKNTVRQVMAATGRELPVIVISTLADEGVVSFAMSQGADDYLVKDEYDEPVFVHVLHRTLERFKRKRLDQAKAALERVDERLALLEDVVRIAMERMGVASAVPPPV